MSFLNRILLVVLSTSFIACSSMPLAKLYYYEVGNTQSGQKRLRNLYICKKNTLTMKSELILDILTPKNDDDFYVIITKNHFYELRLGGYELLKEINKNNYESVHEASWFNKKIKQVLTDDYMMLIETEEGVGFSYGLYNITAEGDTTFSLFYYNQKGFNEMLSEINDDNSFYEI